VAGLAWGKVEPNAMSSSSIEPVIFNILVLTDPAWHTVPVSNCFRFTGAVQRDAQKEPGLFGN
jgi:hypothetical protein